MIAASTLSLLTTGRPPAKPVPTFEARIWGGPRGPVPVMLVDGPHETPTMTATGVVNGVQVRVPLRPIEFCDDPYRSPPDEERQIGVASYDGEGHTLTLPDWLAQPGTTLSATVMYDPPRYVLRRTV